MAYTYLLNLHEEIDLHLEETKKKLSDKTKSLDEIQFIKGRMDSLYDLRQFLSENLDRKLPKRIRKQLLKPH